MCPSRPRSGRQTGALAITHETSSSPVIHSLQARISTSTLCPAQAATSVGGTPESSRQVTPKWRR